MKDTNSTRRGIQWEDLNQIESDVIPGPSVSETVRVVKQRCSSASSRSIAYNLATPSQYSMAGFSRPLPDSRYNTIAEALNQDASPTESPKITTSTPPTVLSFPLSLIEQYDQKGWTPQHGASHKKATTSARPKSAKSTRSMNGGIIGIHHHGPGSRAPSPIPRFDNTQSRPQSAKSSTPANPVTDDLPNRHDSKKLIEVDVKAMYTATESHLQTYELFPQELLAIRKAMQSTGQCTAAHTHHHKDKSRIAENIAKFKERAWKDTFEEEDLMIDDINEEFLAVILGEEVVKAGKERHMIEEMKKQKEEEGQLDMHGHFMKKVRECVVVGSRPVSAASVRTGFSSVRTATTATSMNCGASARPTSAKSLASISSSTSGGLSSSSSRPIGGGTTASFRAKMRPRVFAKHESFTSEDRKLADTSYSLDDERKLRPKSAPPVPVSKHGCTTIAKNMNEFKQVQAYFKQQQFRPKSDIQFSDQEHYKLMVLPAKNEQQQMTPSADETFTIDHYIKSHYETSEETPGVPSTDNLLHETTPNFQHRFSTSIPRQHDLEFLKAVVKRGYDRSKQDTEAIFKVARNLAAFNKIGDLLLWQLCRVVRYTRMNADRCVFTQGQFGTEWFIIITGKVAISISKTNVPEDSVFIRFMTDGDGFGDLSLVSDKARSATVTTVEPTEFFKVEKEDYNLIVKFSKKKESLEIYRFLKDIPMFTACSQSYIYNVSHKATVTSFNDNEFVYVCGGELSRVYFVKKGTFSLIKYLVQKDGTRVPIVVEILEPQRYFGEESVLCGEDEVTESQCTIVAGDWSQMTKSQLKEKLNLQRSSKAGKGWNPQRTSKYEAVMLSSFEARQSILPFLKLSKWAKATNEELLEHCAFQHKEAEWKRNREKTINSLVKEWKTQGKRMTKCVKQLNEEF